MCSGDTQELFKIAKYCKIVLKTFQEIFRNIYSALDKLLGQLGIYATWLSSIAY